jgi:glycine C-acetyltransferase
MSSAIHRNFDARTEDVLETLERTGQLKSLLTIDGPMGPTVRLKDADGDITETLCFCSNNYLGLANDPRVVEAGSRGSEVRRGDGVRAVHLRHLRLHETHRAHHRPVHGHGGSYTFVSCWTANEAIYPTFAEPGDLILSDELNHACIIDGIRLAATIKKGVKKGVFKHADYGDLREKLDRGAKDPEVTGQIWVVTDGVFSMEGDIADLPAMRGLCDEFGRDADRGRQPRARRDGPHGARHARALRHDGQGPRWRRHAAATTSARWTSSPARSARRSAAARGASSRVRAGASSC